MKKNLSITVISKGSGISTPTLRVWEKRYKAFTPSRDDAGQRLYSENDLLKAKLIAALIEKGHSISSVAKLSVPELRQYLETGKDNLLRSPSKSEIKKLLTSLNNFDIDGLVSEVQFQRTSVGAKEFIFKIVLPVMQQIGELVAKNKLSVTQEHIVSSIIRDQLSKIVLPNNGESSEKFVLATPEGNLHELAILIADILCKIGRVPTHYLGAAHPAQCLGEAVSALKCQTIVLGVISSDQWNYEKSMTSYLTTLDKSLKSKVRVVLGGGWELAFPKFKNIKEVKIIKNFEDFDQFLTEIN